MRELTGCANTGAKTNSVQYNNKASNGKIGQNVNTAVYYFFCSLFSC